MAEGIVRRMAGVVILGLVMLIAVPRLTTAEDLSRAILLDVPQEKAESQFGPMPKSQLSPEDSTSINSYRFTADTLKVLAILVEWDNRPGTYSRETLDSLLFSRNVFPGGSVADYYYEVSYGQMSVVGEVIDWHNAGWYTGNFWFEDIFEVLDPVIDYSQFDGDNNGDVDVAVFIRSGNGEEDSQDPDDIWSYAMIYPPGGGPGPFDGGMHIPRWNTSPETRPLRDPLNPKQFLGVDVLNRIRVFAHEMGHGLGLPDLYDYDDKLDTTTYFTPDDYNDHPVMDWCLMGYYGYGLFSIGTDMPTHLCGWSKKELGWIDPVVLTVPGDHNVEINNFETTKDSSLYKIPVNPSQGEYFLLEYRNPNSAGQFDKVDSDFSCFFWPHLTYGCDPLDRGLLITHVHDSLGAPYYRINNGTPDHPHYTVALEDIGYNPDRDAWSNPEGFVTDSAQWWYPYETRRAAPFSNDVSGQDTFGMTTYPNSSGYFGVTGILISVDSIVDDKLYAYVHVPGEFVLGDANKDGEVGPGDVVHLLNYLFRDGPAPDPYEAGDCNCSGVINGEDVVYLLNYLFRGGPPPSC
jgi:M6 family metalloprotease-like protein